VYHSQYDNYFWLSRIGDPGFLQNAALARFLSVLLSRIASVDVLPMRYSSYARAIAEHVEEVEKKAEPFRPLELNELREAAKRWQAAAEALEARMDARLASGKPLPAESAARFNHLLMDVERALTEERGLDSRPFFKHLIYAPQPTYRREVLPRIWEAIDAAAWEDIEGYERQIAKAIEQAIALHEEARLLLDGS
jgi:N-acetylated-alpha-linked acidic dipeptidase